MTEVAEVLYETSESVASSQASTTESTPSSVASIASVTQSAASTPLHSATESVASSVQSTESTASSVASVAAGPPEKYKWTVPPNVEVPSGLSERIATIARELGLNNEAGQRLFDAERTRIATETQSNANGGEAWQARVKAWTQESAADPELGGSPEKFTQSVQAARRALDKYGSPEVVKFLDDTGFGAKREVISLLAKIGRAMSETPLVIGAPPSVAPKSTTEILYGADGMGPKNTT